MATKTKSKVKSVIKPKKISKKTVALTTGILGLLGTIGLVGYKNIKKQNLDKSVKVQDSKSQKDTLITTLSLINTVKKELQEEFNKKLQDKFNEINIKNKELEEEFNSKIQNLQHDLNWKISMK